MLSAGENPPARRLSLLLLCDDLPLDGLVVVRAAACGAQPVHIRPDVVEAKLADLEAVSARVRRWIAQESKHRVPDTHKDTVGSCGRRDRTPRCREGCGTCGQRVTRREQESRGCRGQVGETTGEASYQQSSSSSKYVSCGAMATVGGRRQNAGLGNVVAQRWEADRSKQAVGRFVGVAEEMLGAKRDQIAGDIMGR